MGVLHTSERECYEDLLASHIEEAVSKAGSSSLDDMFNGFGKVNTWTVE